MRVQDGEQHGVHADADPEDQHRGDRKAAVPVQQPDGEAEILPERVDERQSALIAIGLLHLLDAAKGAPGGVPRLDRGHAVSHVLVGEQVEMSANLFVEAALAPARDDQIQHARDQHSNAGHD
jgi:hypothetical protein